MFIINIMMTVISFTISFKNTLMAQIKCDHPLTKEEGDIILASSIQETFGIIDGILNVFGITVNFV